MRVSGKRNQPVLRSLRSKAKPDTIGNTGTNATDGTGFLSAGAAAKTQQQYKVGNDYHGSAAAGLITVGVQNGIGTSNLNQARAENSGARNNVGSNCNPQLTASRPMPSTFSSIGGNHQRPEFFTDTGYPLTGRPECFRTANYKSPVRTGCSQYRAEPGIFRAGWPHRCQYQPD